MFWMLKGTRPAGRLGLLGARVMVPMAWLESWAGPEELDFIAVTEAIGFGD